MKPPAASLNPRFGALAPFALPRLNGWVQGMELEASFAGWVLT
jgi:hypothetical protein